MLNVMLAGLVLQKILSEKEAEYISKELQKRKVPPTIHEILLDIQKVREKYDH